MSNTRKFTVLFLFFALMASPIFAQDNQEENKQIVSKQELTQFADTFQKLQDANRSAQQEMVKVVEAQGLTMKRFNEIHVAYINTNMKNDATAEEMKKHKAAIDQIEKMQDELQKKMDGIVEKNGLGTKKYQHIAETMRNDVALQKQYKELVSAETAEKE